MGLVVEAEPLLMYSVWLNSNLFELVAAFQVKRALGTTVPRKKIRVSVSLSAVALSEFIVKVSDWVPPMVVEAAEMLLTVKVLIKALFQYLAVEPISRVLLASGIRLELIEELTVKVSALEAPKVVELPETLRFLPTKTSPLVWMAPLVVVAMPTPRPPEMN